jgi:ATP-dependent NAD(P)H-hydrate dehydratase
MLLPRGQRLLRFASYFSLASSYGRNSTGKAFQLHSTYFGTGIASTTFSSTAFAAASQSTATMSSSSYAVSAASWKIDSDLCQTSLKRCIPPISASNHKGSSGRVGILGGSKRYTGAPFYAAMASLKVGSDLSFVFCAEEATMPIKCYSPELMVASVYVGKDFDAIVKKDQIESKEAQQLVDDMVEEVTSMMEKLHSLVIGPGLGRCPLVFRAVAKIIQEAQSKYHLPLVMDADSLFMLTQPDYHRLLTDDSLVVLTPNAIERKRLDDSNVVLPSTCVILEKGAEDKIEPENSEWQPLKCNEQGGLKRSGGIGDVLAGTTGTLMAWNSILTEHDQASPNDVPLACWTACCFVKHATKKAFDIHRRSMTAPDVLDMLGPAVDDMTNETIEN